MLALADLAPLLGLTADDPALETSLAALFPDASLEFETKTYPDATYRNYYALGLSLCFLPQLDSIDIINASPPVSSKSKKPSYTTPHPLVLRFANTSLVFPPRKAGEKEIVVPRPEVLEIELNTQGREIVRRMGEPTRKGAGGWVGVWLEWGDVALKAENGTVHVGIMLELKDPKGAEKIDEEQKKMGMGGLWDRAAFWPWGSIKVFRHVK